MDVKKRFTMTRAFYKFYDRVNDDVSEGTKIFIGRLSEKKTLKLLKKLDDNNTVLRCRIDYVEQVYTMPAEMFIAYATEVKPEQEQTEEQETEE